MKFKNNYSATDLRIIQDWVVKCQLLTRMFVEAEIATDYQKGLVIPSKA